MRRTSPRGFVGGLEKISFSKAVLTGSDIEQLLSPIASALQKVAPHDYAAFAFRDEKAGGRLRLREVSSRQHQASSTNKATLSSSAKSREPGLTLSQVSAPFDHLDAEIRFGYWIPLVRRGDAVGALFVGSRQDEHLEQRVSDLLARSPQVSGALEMIESFRLRVDTRDHLREEKAYLEEQLRAEWRIENLVGISTGFRDVLERVKRLAPGQEPIIIAGELGTEKELIARVIHQLSPRSHRLFVKVNCAAYPSHILAKKLYGYEKTSHSGAPLRRPGLLELAHMGTLFLEEVGELSSELQSAVLLAIRENGLAQPEGQARVSHDIRFLASTSRDLSALASAGQFNNNLYKRLSAFPIELLPLRERQVDIPLLANHFVRKFSRQLKKTIKVIPQETMSSLCASQWQGNLRELENFMERAVILTPASTLCAPLLELDAACDESLEAVERRHILRILRDSKGVIGGFGGAASRLGVKRTTLNSKLKKLGILRDAFP
jgi:transcriptional regulator with GAF, ATPase, and Fis domain